MINETDRLLLRRWIAEDREPFFRLNSDDRVMEFMPGCLSRSESDLLFDRIEEHFRKHSFGPYALESREDHAFIGYLGLAVPAFTAHFTPCVEIGWRLSATHWGRGLATEGARAVVKYAFEVLKLDALVSFTVPANVRSRRIYSETVHARRAS